MVVVVVVVIVVVVVVVVVVLVVVIAIILVLVLWKYSNPYVFSQSVSFPLHPSANFSLLKLVYHSILNTELRYPAAEIPRQRLGDALAGLSLDLPAR